MAVAALSREAGRGFDPATGSGLRTASLAEVLDRLLECGIVLEGNVTLGLAGIDLFYLDLRALLAAVDTVWPDGRPTVPLGAAPGGCAALPAPPHSAPRSAPAVLRSHRRAAHDLEKSPPTPAAAATPDAQREGGLTRLVLGLAELLHEVLERQALRRMQKGRLSDAEIEAVGAALYAQALEIERLRREFAPAKAGGTPLFALRLSDPSL